MASYNPNIPTVGDFILQSFSQLRANFQAINAAFSVNHYSMAKDDLLAGRHNALNIQNQTAVGNPVTAATQCAIFTKLANGASNLFFSPNNSQTPIQLTYSSLSTDTLTSYSFIAGPFIVYFGFVNAPTLNQVVNLTPASTLIYVDLQFAFLNQILQNIPALATPTNVVGSSFKITYPTSYSTTPGISFGIFYIAVGQP